MSFDISSGPRSCDHLQILERYQLNPFDFRTLQYKANTQFNLRAPINGVSLVRLYFKGVLVSPSDPNYGHTIVVDPSRVQESYPFQKIVFNKPIRERTPLIEVSYITIEGACLKCGGTGQVTDWSVSPSGTLNRIHGRRKLGQACMKYMLTSRNAFNPNLTTPIRSYIGKKFGLTVSDSDIATAVTNALSAYQSIQKAQSTVQTLDPHEMIQDVQSVSAAQSPSDPTVVNLSVAVLTYGSSEAVPLNLNLQTTTG